jgi:SRSO17 transposase
MSMDRRFEARKRELLADCEVSPEIFNGMVKRLAEFVEPYVERLWRVEQEEHARTYVQGLLSDLKRKNAESIAYRHDQDRIGLQLFIGASPWDHQPLIEVLVDQVGTAIGEPDGVISFDPSAFPKKGNMSVGVQRQWCGRLGKVENCQVGVFMGYATREEQTLVNMRLYLPKSWAKDRRRRKACGVPKEIRYQTRHQLALDMLAESGASLPHAWVTGDDEMGRPYGFRRDLHALSEQYLLAVPSTTLIRDLEADPPSYCGRGPHPQVPFQRVSKWCESLPKGAWTQVEVRDAEKGPLFVDIVKRRVSGRTERRKVAPPETLVVIRWRDETDAAKVDYYLSNAPYNTPLDEFARVSKLHSRIEQCIKRSKSEAGLAQYQVRSWNGWHHHVALSLIATWFLVQETRSGKKNDSSDDGTSGAGGIVIATSPTCSVRHSRANSQGSYSLVGAN